MDRNDTDNIINIDSEERDSRAGRGNKKLAAVFCLMALACLGGLVYTTVRINDQKNKLEGEVKSSKEARHRHQSCRKYRECESVRDC